MHASRCNPLAAMIGKIFERKGTALALKVVDHHRRALTFVEFVAAVLRNSFQSACQIGVLEDLACLWRSVGEPCRARIGEIELVRPPFKGAQIAIKIVPDDGRNRMAFARVLDRRRQHVSHRHFAKTFMHGEPAIDRPWDRNRQRSDSRDASLVAWQFGNQIVQRLVHRAATRAVDAVQLIGLRVVYNRKQIAAYAVAGRLHQAERCVGRDCRINRVAAVLEDIERDLRCERVRGCSHAVFCMNRAARPRRADGPAACTDLLIDWACRFSVTSMFICVDRCG